MSKLRAGGYCWVLLAAVVLAMDYWLIRNGHDTMSIVFGDALVHPIRRRYVIAAWAIITGHLFSNLYEHRVPKGLARFDPIGLLVRQIHPKVRYETNSAQAWTVTVETLPAGTRVDTDQGTFS